MPDITLCKGALLLEVCPIKDTCKRYKAPPSQWQSYFAEMPYDPATNSCAYYIPWRPNSNDPNTQAC